MRAVKSLLVQRFFRELLSRYKTLCFQSLLEACKQLNLDINLHIKLQIEEKEICNELPYGYNCNLFASIGTSHQDCFLCGWH